MSQSAHEYLKLIHHEIQFLETKMQGLNKGALLLDERLRRAFLRSLDAIAEATRQLPENLFVNYPLIQWREIADNFDHLVHQDSGIDFDFIWDVLENHIPQFLEVIEDLIVGGEIL